MTAHYSTARQNGLLPPFAAIVAAWKSSPSVATQIKTMHPSGAAILFAAAYLAGLAGSLAALLVVAAFLAGLYLVKQPAIVPSSPRALPPAIPPMAPVVAAAPVSQFPGMIVSRVTLATPSANGKAPKVATP